MNRTDKMLLGMDFLIVAVYIYFGYELHDMILTSGKPPALYPFVLLLTIAVSAAMRLYDELSIFSWFRRYGRHICRPYLWISGATSRFWSRFTCLRNNNIPQDSCIYRHFFFLPVLPINLSVCMAMIPSAWHSVTGMAASVMACFGTFVIAGFISYTILEFVYRIAAGIMSDRYRHDK